MRPNNSNKRTRGRSRSKNTNPLARSYESNGPDVKIRGSALQVADKYAQLARDAQSSGDRIMAENYFQHAEHYYRIVAQAYEQNNQNQQQRDRREDGDRNNRYDDRQPYRGGEQPVINGYDGLDDDDESNRRNLRASGNHNGNGNGNGSTPHDHNEGDADGDDDDHQDDVIQHANGVSNGRAVGGRTMIAADEEADEAEASSDNADEEGAQAAPKPTRSRKAAASASPETADGAEAAPKPRRRTRSTAKRTRRPASETAEQPAPEASEPTS